MDKLLDPTAGKPTKESRTVTVSRDNLEGTNLIFPVEEAIDSVAINANKKLPVVKVVILSGPIHHENLVSHCTFHGFHLNPLEVFHYVSPFSRKRLKYFP